MEIDPRGPRFGAAITTVVLAVVMITQSGWLLAAQLMVFTIGALAGLRYAPYGVLYRRFIRPRLGPAAVTEAEGPPRFAQAVGAVIALAGVVGFALGEAVVGTVFTALALAAAFLNAAFDVCVGCQVYLFHQRLFQQRLFNQRTRPSAQRTVGPDREVYQ
jgi:Domain of unknown function (DUF4395)